MGVPEDRLERLANLVTYLLDEGGRGRRGATYAEIVSAIPGYPTGDDARRRAFERDKKLLRDEDIPLVEADGRYRIPAEEYYLPDLGLSEDEQLALHLAVAAVPLGEGGDGGGSALQKLTIGSGLDIDARAAAATALADLDEHPLLPALHAAIRKRATVTFTHGERRTVEPVVLRFRDGHWYLSGYDRLREADRNFRVDRIEGEVEIGDPGGFERRGDASAGVTMPREPWLFGDPAGEERVVAVVRVDGVLATKAMADAGASASVEHHPDGSVTLTMPVAHRAAFRSWVLGLLDHAEVVGPAEQRADVVTWLKDIAG